MKLHDIHIAYLLKQPFLHSDNELLTFFALIERFPVVERLRMLDLTCCTFGIDVDVPYWNDDGYCQEIYEEFEARMKRYATKIDGYLLTFVIVQSVLTSLWDRCDKELKRKTNKGKHAEIAAHVRARVKAGLSKRITRKAVLRIIGAEQPGSYESSAARYIQFCEQVVEHLM